MTNLRIDFKAIPQKIIQKLFAFINGEKEYQRFAQLSADRAKIVLEQLEPHHCMLFSNKIKN